MINKASGTGILSKSALACVLVGTLLLVLQPAALGQLSMASINGIVRDTSGANIPGAKIVLQNVTTGEERSTVSNETGYYTIVNIPPGSYSLTTSKQGFETTKEAEFRLAVNQTMTADVTLKVGAAAETVMVAGTATQLEASTAELGTVIGSAEVNNLPLNGRNFTQLLLLTPGASPINVTQNAGGFATNPVGTFSFPAVNGQGNRSNMYMLDGINDTQPIANTYNVAPIADDIQEFKVDSHNDLAQFGGVMGGVVNIVTKSGTNSFHGTGWEFLRNDAFDARNYFDHSPKVAELRQNQFGANVGGPVILPHYNGRNRTFFFASYEGVRIREGQTTLFLVPTPSQLAGDLSSVTAQIYNPFSTRPDPNRPGQYLRDPFPNNQIPSNLIDPRMVAIAKLLFPAPINTGVPGTNGRNSSPIAQNSNEYSLRGDENIGSKDRFWGRFTDIETSFAVPGPFATAGAISNNNYSAHQIASGWNHTFGTTAILDVEFGHNRGEQTGPHFLTKLNAQQALQAGGFSTDFTCGFTGGPRSCYIPSLNIPGFASFGEGYSENPTANYYTWKGNFSKVFGKHFVSLGTEFNRNLFSSPNNGESVGFSSFQTSNLETSAGGNALASFLLGVPDNASKTNTFIALAPQWIDGFYVQDQWKASERLTVNVGLRYDVSTWPLFFSDNHGHTYAGDLDLRNGTYILESAPPPCTQTNAPPCIPGNGTLPAHVVLAPNKRIFHTSYDNVQPRFGLAYRVGEKTAIHASFGRFFDNWAYILETAQNLHGDWPSTGQLLAQNLNPTVPTITAENPFVGGATLPAATPFTQTEWYPAPDIKNAYSNQWSFGIQQVLTPSTALTVNYVGSTDYRTDVGGFKNVATTPGPGPVSARQPFPYISPTFYDQSIGKAYYDAFQLSLKKTASQGLTYLVSYTWSKAIDIGSDGFYGVEGTNIQNPYNLRDSKSVAGYDIPHILTGSWVYQLPVGKGMRYSTGSHLADNIIGNWQINGILTLRSGQPFTVSAPGGIPNTGNITERANLIGNPHLANPSPLKWFNTAAFAAPPPYTFGTSGRNSLRSDWGRNLDLSVFREFPISENNHFEFRAEAFGVTNTPVFGIPDAGVTDANFGQVLSASGSRVVQFALKFYF